MTGNLYTELPVQSLPTELCDILLAHHGLRIERIVSTGQASPPGFWYDLTEDEWVVLLSGTASLRFADEDEARQLMPGDWLYIPAHRRHRVESTDAHVPSVWLALYCQADAKQGVPP